MGTLLQGGIPLLQALETTGKSVGSRLLRDAISKSRVMVREGQPLSRGMAASGIFPPLAVEMVNVGESTGSLPEMLHSVAEFFDDDVNTMMTAAMSLVEPAIMLLMGVFRSVCFDLALFAHFHLGGDTISKSYGNAATTGFVSIPRWRSKKLV